MPKPERRVQLAFDFDNPPEQPAGRIQLPYETLVKMGISPPEVGRFVHRVEQQITVRTPGDAAIYLMNEIYAPFEVFDQEELWVLLLDTKSKITHAVMVYRGGLNTVYLRIGELFKEAVKVNAASIIVSHVHPSGDPTPSPQDVRVTEDVVKAAKILGIELLDHIVVGDRRWVSLKERGLGFG